jgi:hypothetical protein
MRQGRRSNADLLPGAKVNTGADSRIAPRVKGGFAQLHFCRNFRTSRGTCRTSEQGHRVRQAHQYSMTVGFVAIARLAH